MQAIVVTAYFIRTISYMCKTLITLTTGVDVTKTFLPSLGLQDKIKLDSLSIAAFSVL